MIDFRIVITPTGNIHQYRWVESTGDKGVEYWSEWQTAKVVHEYELSKDKGEEVDGVVNSSG